MFQEAALPGKGHLVPKPLGTTPPDQRPQKETGPDIQLFAGTRTVSCRSSTQNGGGMSSLRGWGMGEVTLAPANPAYGAAATT